jgi:hypothetical protein
MSNRHGIDLIRYAVHMLDHCNESFNQRFHRAEDLLKIANACQQSKWDFYPDQWDEQQIQECLLFGRTPDWAERQDGKIYPVYLHDGPKEFQVGITWTMTATVPIRAHNLDEALDWAEGDMPLPNNGEYLDDSFEIDQDTTNEMNASEREEG